jgi:transcriptional regulator with XRE-family HTH domain
MPYRSWSYRAGHASVSDVSDRQGSPHPWLRALGMQLRKEREAKGLTVEKLAEAASVSVRQLSRIEAGRGSPSVLWLLSIAGGLRIRPSELLGRVWSNGGYRRTSHVALDTVQDARAVITSGGRSCCQKGDGGISVRHFRRATALAVVLAAVGVVPIVTAGPLRRRLAALIIYGVYDGIYEQANDSSGHSYEGVSAHINIEPAILCTSDSYGSLVDVRVTNSGVGGYAYVGYWQQPDGCLYFRDGYLEADYGYSPVDMIQWGIGRLSPTDPGYDNQF